MWRRDHLSRDESGLIKGKENMKAGGLDLAMSVLVLLSEPPSPGLCDILYLTQPSVLVTYFFNHKEYNILRVPEWSYSSGRSGTAADEPKADVTPDSGFQSDCLSHNSPNPGCFQPDLPNCKEFKTGMNSIPTSSDPSVVFNQ
ncbi:hypothetical protein BTVI_36008 [Pitangus sulphuratus]|nr:hypothetical protein BTVI_36008 [Pitangus sulphuratus]